MVQSSSTVLHAQTWLDPFRNCLKYYIFPIEDYAKAHNVSIC